MVLSHLEWKEYDESYSILFNIIECQDHFNEKMLDFLESNIEHLQQILKRPVDYDIVRYYLVLIVEDNRKTKKLELIEKSFQDITLWSDNIINNPFSKEEEKIRKDMNNRYLDITTQLNKFKNDITALNQLIPYFRRSIEYLICDEITGIEGKCYIEKKLSLFNKFKSCFCRW